MLYVDGEVLRIPDKLLKGPGEGEGVDDLGNAKSSFLLFLVQGMSTVNYQMRFTGSKNIVPSRSYKILKS